MRDPTTLAHRLPNPIPTITKQNARERERYGNGFHWQMRIFSRRRYISPFIYVFGRELFFDSLIDIWHTDPLGDIGPPCHGRKHWKWHIHHMSVRFPVWGNFKQKHITKCAWCGKKSNKELGRVNHSDGRTVYHARCSSESHRAFHEHDPRGCYNCSGKKAFDWQRNHKTNSTIAKQLFGPKR